MKICPNCGTSSPDTNAFCNRCGYAYNNMRSAPRPNPAPAPNPVPPAYRPPVNVAPSNKGRGFGIASMICGIVALLFAFIYLGIILGILGIIFGAVSKSKGYRGGMATAGIVCASIALGLSTLIVVLAVIGASALSFMY